MQDEIRLRLSSGRELRLYRDDCGRLMAQLSGACSRCIDGRSGTRLCAQDCGDCVRVTYDVGGETWAAALKESELALGVGRVAHKI